MRRFTNFWIALLMLAMTMAMNTAHAEPSTYAPDYCEFKITFPEEPYIEEKCDGGYNKDECYKRTSFTKVYDLDATLKVTVICNPIGAELKDSFNQGVMVATLEEMTKERVTEKFESTFREEETFKIAGLVGEGKMGMTPTIYIAQLWIGQKSAFSLEAELTGESHKEADALFSEILKSVQPINPPPPKDAKLPEPVKKMMDEAKEGNKKDVPNAKE